MHVITLSDNTGDKIRQARTQRENDYNRRLGEYQMALTAFANIRKAKRAAAGAAWSGRHFGKFIGASIAVVANLFATKPSSPRMAIATDQERVWEAGNEGEEDALEMLKAQLDGSWTAIVGYRNRKGEGDILLVGPTGLLGLEIKNVNGVVHAENDVWTRDKFDRYGNIVERNIPITDRGGRSPACQINEVCDALVDFMAKRNRVAPILRGVVLTHSRSRVGLVEKPTVHFIGKATELNVKELFGHYKLTTPIETSGFVKLIQQDHAFHNDALHRRPRPQTTATAPR